MLPKPFDEIWNLVKPVDGRPDGSSPAYGSSHEAAGPGPHVTRCAWPTASCDEGMGARQARAVRRPRVRALGRTGDGALRASPRTANSKRRRQPRRPTSTWLSRRCRCRRSSPTRRAGTNSCAEDGDAELGGALKELARTLPWFVEAALARALGPIGGPARRRYRTPAARVSRIRDAARHRECGELRARRGRPARARRRRCAPLRRGRARGRGSASTRWSSALMPLSRARRRASRNRCRADRRPRHGARGALRLPPVRASRRMPRMMRIARLVRIHLVALRFGLDEFLLGHERVRGLRPFVNRVLFWRDLSQPRGVRLRLALEDLGPIFVKFGQMLSTRRDLLPPDIADELAKLQDRVPPFPAEQVLATLARAYGKPVDQVFKSFDLTPVASASVAQVHFADLPDGTPVAVKVLRPDIHKVIEHDLALMQTAAGLVERLWSDGKRLRPLAVVAEFEKTIRDELDLTREAANCSQLRRNFKHSPLLLVPEVYWDWTTTEVLVMERMAGIPIGRIDELQRAGIDLKRLSRAGVEIFFTQVFRDGFFHADMHPGNIFVATDGVEPRQVHRARLRHHGHAVGDRQELSRAEFPRVLPPRLPPRGHGAHRIRLGAAGHARRRARSRDPRGVRADLRPAAEGDFAGQGAGVAVPRVAPLQRRDPAAADAAAEDAAQRRRTGPAARPGPRPVGDGQALSRTLDARPDRLAGAAAAADRRGALHRRRAARTAAPAAPATAGAAGGVGLRHRGARRRADDAQPLAGGRSPCCWWS